MLGNEISQVLRRIQHVLILKQIDVAGDRSTFWLSIFRSKESVFQRFLDGSSVAEISDADAKIYIQELREEVAQLLSDAGFAATMHFSIQHHPKRIPLDLSKLDASVVDRLETLRPYMDYVVANPRNVDTWLQTRNVVFDGLTPLNLLQTDKTPVLLKYCLDEEEKIERSMNMS
jgi:hypothetical protein